eukprot:PhM_4_TR2596/c0_g1_i1/m.4721
MMRPTCARLGYLKQVFAKRKTPIPPKPVQEEFSPLEAVRARVGGFVDPEKPHWDDPRFETRGKIAWFDLFGMNRDWSMTLFKFFCASGVMFLVNEYRMARYSGEDITRMRGGLISATPSYSVAEEDASRTTRDSLRGDGFAYVGYKHLDFVGAEQDEQKAKARGTL